MNDASTSSLYVDLYVDFFDAVTDQCAAMGLRDSDGAASSILMRFYERDLLGVYDARVGKLSAYVHGTARRYAMGMRDQEQARYRREPSLEWVDEDDLAIDLDPVHYVLRDEQVCELVEQVETIGRYLDTVPPRSGSDRCRLGCLWRAVVQQFRSGLDKPDRSALAAQFGVSVSTIRYWLAYLTQKVREVFA